MTMNLIDSKTKRNRFTRMCIGEALVSLISEMEFNKISIFHICKKAGVSRRTYYNYYITKEEVLHDYLSEIITEYMYEIRNATNIGKIMSYEHILFSIHYLIQYKNFFLILSKSGLYSLIINTINDYVDKYCLENNYNSVYVLYCYFGALINTFTKWAEKDVTVTSEELARMIDKFLCREDDYQENE